MKHTVYVVLGIACLIAIAIAGIIGGVVITAVFQVVKCVLSFFAERGVTNARLGDGRFKGIR